MQSWKATTKLIPEGIDAPYKIFLGTTFKIAKKQKSNLRSNSRDECTIKLLSF